MKSSTIRKHPYTWGLLSAMPDLDTDDDRLYSIPGTPAQPFARAGGRRFCPAQPLCHQD